MNSTTTNAAAAGVQSAPPPPPLQQQQQQGKIMKRFESTNKNSQPTTFVEADTSSFKQVVQMLTGSAETAKKQVSRQEEGSNLKRQQWVRGFKLYERRNNLLHDLKINPRHATPEILSPTMLDFPSLVLSPVTPLIPDPFAPSQPNNNNNNNNLSFQQEAAEAKAIREKGFYLHPSPSPPTTPRHSQPHLLPLFPITSPLPPSSS